MRRMLFLSFLIPFIVVGYLAAYVYYGTKMGVIAFRRKVDAL